MRSLLLISLLAAPLSAQQSPPPSPPPQPAFTSDSGAVMQVVNDLFQGMRVRDTARMRALFHPSATMRSAANTRAGRVITDDSVGVWIRGVAGAPDTLLLDERTGVPRVRVDGNFTSVWVPYEFWLGHTFSHCGADLFSLARTVDGWKIVFVADSRRRLDCPAAPAGSVSPIVQPPYALDSALAVAAVLRLLDGMRTRDTAQMRAGIAGIAPMRIAGWRRSGEAMVPLIGAGDSDGWIKGVATPGPALDERLGPTAVEVDGNLANVSAYYEFRRGEDWSHCGMDQFILGRAPTGWKMLAVAYSIRQEGCTKSLTLDPRQVALRDLVAAERAFARYADSADVRDAFVWALSPDAIAIDSGGVHNMHDQYLAKPVRHFSLGWEPAWVDVSADGLFGISTGPWEFRPARDSAVAGRGQYLTIWKKGPDGWKVALDHGITGDSTANLLGPVDSPAEASVPDRTAGVLDRLLTIERAALRRKEWVDGVRSLASPQVRVMRDGSPNGFGHDAVRPPDGVTGPLTFVSLGGSVAGSADLAGSWGTWKAGTKSGAYVHIWRHTAQGWRIVVELMN